MFDHVTLRASDRAASERFYDTVLGTLGIGRTSTGETYTEWGDFTLAQATDERPVTRRLHIGFVAPSREDAGAFWRAGTEAGHADDGPPGPRPEYGPDYYGAFLLDPDGNSAEAVRHGSLRAGGTIDHLWVRVADVDASARFYTTIAPYAGFEPIPRAPDRVQLKGPSGSFSVLTAERPTEHAHVAFPAPDDATVAAFHRAAVGAGYRDEGAPGERPEYHAGYHAAFVLDPDGNNVELVVHHRRG